MKLAKIKLAQILSNGSLVFVFSNSTAFRQSSFWEKDGKNFLGNIKKKSSAQKKSDYFPNYKNRYLSFK